MRFIVIFIAEFVFSLHFAATLYINSSFLEHFFPLEMIGALYVLGAIASLLLFFRAPNLLNRWGNRKFMFIFLFLTLAATIGAAYAMGPIDALLFFILYAAVSPMIFYALDVLVEEITTNRKTGQIRGLYLTVLNAAIALGPVLIALVPIDNKFKYFYLAAAAVLLPLFVLGLFLKSRHARKRYQPHSLPFRHWWRSKSVRRVTIARFILEFFYGLMIIYTPIYLHDVIGFAWNEIGTIFAIMLLPFVLFEWPVGALADKETGEKEIMSLGFGVMGISLLFMPFLGHNIVHWTIILFLSRIGAAFTEITTESYFFKRINSEDTGLISIFRLGRSVGLIVGAAASAAILHFFSLSAIFVMLAAFSFLGQGISRKIVDTR